jgi:hypothetical protein
LGILLSEEMYWDYHHKLGHGIAFGLLLAGAMAAFLRPDACSRFSRTSCVFTCISWLDYFGSGPGWPIHYFGPFSDASGGNADAWPLPSWQNTTAAALLLAWTLWIAVRQRRTPLEVLMPSLDQKAIAWIDRRRGATRDGAVIAE